MSQQPNLPTIERATHGNRGKAFERELAATHEYYFARKLAKVEQNPTEWRYIGKSEYDNLKITKGEIVALTNTGRFIKKVKSDIDFSGTVKGGRSIVFDAKETDGKSFPLSQVKEHQVRILNDQEKVGAVSGLMIRFSEINRVFFVPAQIVDRAIIEMLYKRGRKSLALADLEKEAVEIETGGNLIDWYKALFTKNTEK